MDEMTNKTITVMALGGAGCRILRKITENPLSGPLNLLAVDTDRDHYRTASEALAYGIIDTVVTSKKTA